MKIEYGWYSKFNIWAVYVIDDKGITKEFEYAGNIGTVKIIINSYIKKYDVHSIKFVNGEQ